MTEQRFGNGIEDGESLAARLKALKVKNAGGACLLSSFVPVRGEWKAGTAKKIGADIGHAVMEGDANIWIYSVEKGLVRRELTQRRLTGGPTVRRIDYSRRIYGAQIEGVTDIDIGRNRTLPLLRLMEFAEPKSEFVISVPDLAYHVQSTPSAEVMVT